MRSEHLVFVDESGCHPGIGPLRGWAPKGKPLIGPEQVYARKQHVSIIAALSLDGLIARMTVRGGVGTQQLQRFVERYLAPVLSRGRVVCWDNLAAHKNIRVRRMIEARGARVKFLPAYSPDLNPIEAAWSKLKHFIRKNQAYSIAGLRSAIYRAYRKITVSDAAGWFRHCGYNVEKT